MKPKAFNLCLLAACLSLAPSIASAQEVVHAVEGSVKNINQKTRFIVLNTDDGSEGAFRDLEVGKPMGLNKSMTAEVMPADKFANKGNQVILFFTGDDAIRTAVAVDDLGNSTLQKASGTVVSCEKGRHLLTIKNSAGATQTFHIDPAKTVADTMTGVIDGAKFDANKGQQVRVIATGTDGNETALLIVAAL